MGFSFMLKPNATFNSANDYAVRLEAAHTMDDLTFKVSASDATFGNRGGKGVSTKDVVMSVEKADNWAVTYDVANNAPAVTFETGFTVKGTAVSMEYNHDVASGDCSLKGEMDVNDKFRVTAVHSTSQGMFSWGQNSWDVSARYEHDDNTAVTPSFNLGTQAMHLSVEHKLDSSNRVRVDVNSKSKDGELMWIQDNDTKRASGTGKMSSNGMMVKMTGNLTADGMKRMPRLMVGRMVSVDM